jgi:Helix-turn-helix domain
MPLTWSIGPAADAESTAAAAGITARPDSLLAEELVRLLRQPRPPRLALELGEAAAALGISPKFLTEHIRHELRLVRRGRKVLVPVRELERWLAESAALLLEGQR